MLVQWNRRFKYSMLFIIGWGLMVAAGGCGKSGPETYDVSGTVTYNGQPVPVGQILFQPDISQGNKGPGCVVRIKEGRYDTSENGKGHIGGPHILVISGGTDQSNVPPEERTGGGQFREVKLKLDLPKSTSEQDLSLPVP